MTTALIATPDIEAIEQVLVNGDLSKLTPVQRVSYYNRVCESLDLNPLTKPFDYINLNGKLVLYAKRDATEQLRKLHAVSVTIKAREVVEDCYIVTAQASMPFGPERRCDESIGAVSIAGLKGENRANAMMKAETKAKRRVTLSICGLGLLDETEVDTLTAPAGYVVEAPKQLDAPVPSATAGGLSVEGPTRVAPSGESSAQLRTSYISGLPGAELPPGAVLIERIDMTPTKNPNVKKYLLTLSTGETVSTIKDRIAAQCEQWAQNRTPVVIEAKASKWGLELVDVHSVAFVQAAAETHAEPVLDSEIPF